MTLITLMRYKTVVQGCPRQLYHGLPITDYRKFDTELVTSIINDLKLGKALDNDGLSAVLSVVLANYLIC